MYKDLGMYSVFETCNQGKYEGFCYLGYSSTLDQDTTYTTNFDFIVVQLSISSW